MNNATRLILALVILSVASVWAMAQHDNHLLLDIELAIREKEPEWTLMNRWVKAQSQSAGLRWKLDQHEIFAWIIVERSVSEAIRFFEDDGLGALPNKTPRQMLNIGDGCYLRRSGPHTAIVLRKGNVLVRLGSESSTPELLTRFALDIGAVLDRPDANPNSTDAKNENATSHRRNGELAIKNRDYQQAIREFKKAIELAADSAETHYQLGTAYYEVGDYKNAATAFEDALRLQPDFFDALIALGKTYRHSGLPGRAVEVLRKAVLLRPDNIDAKTAFGTALLLAGQAADAVVVFREVARLSPESAFVYASLGQAYRLTGKFQEALNALQQALQISPEDPVVHNYLALTYESLGRQQDAVAAYRQAITIKGDYAEAHYNLGLLYLSLGERSAAQAEYEKLKDLNSDLADALSRKITGPNP